MDAPLFSHRIETVHVGDLDFRLCILDDLDEALDHYIKVSPSDTDRIPYFTRLWESAGALSEFLAAHPELCRQRRILEVGCGLGLPSLTASALGAADVTASDFHPDNRAFFMKNVAMNGLENIAYHQMDWRQPDLPGNFDLILGSDLIYEKTMVGALTTCVNALLATDGIFILADPGRAALQETATAMERLGFRWRLLTAGTIWLLFFSRTDHFPAATDGQATFGGPDSAP